MTGSRQVCINDANVKLGRRKQSTDDPSAQPYPEGVFELWRATDCGRIRSGACHSVPCMMRHDTRHRGFLVFSSPCATMPFCEKLQVVRPRLAEISVECLEDGKGGAADHPISSGMGPGYPLSTSHFFLTQSRQPLARNSALTGQPNRRNNLISPWREPRFPLPPVIPRSVRRCFVLKPEFALIGFAPPHHWSPSGRRQPWHTGGWENS
jgi:hypothetical protein